MTFLSPVIPGGETPPINYDYPPSSGNQECVFPPFLLKHAGKLTSAFFTAAIILSVSAGLAKDPTAKAGLTVSACAFAGFGVFFCKKTADRALDNQIEAVAESYQVVGS